MNRVEYNELFLRYRPVQNIEEFFWLVNLVEALKPETIIEIGVENGGSLKFWDKLLPSSGLLIGIDITPTTADRFSWWKDSAHIIKLITGDSTDPNTVRRTEEALQGMLADFLFIDGNHSFQAVSEDFKNYSPFLKSGGLVGFHDVVYHHEVGEFFRSLPRRKEKMTVFDRTRGHILGTGVWWKPECEEL